MPTSRTSDTSRPSRRDGYRSWERVVRVAANQRLELAIDIEPMRQGPTPSPPGEPRLD